MKKLIEVDIKDCSKVRVQSTPQYQHFQTHEQINWAVQSTGGNPETPGYVFSGEWSDGENSIYTALWGNQSGAWGLVIVYFPIDGWPKTKKFEWKHGDCAAASYEVTAWLNQTILRS